MSFTDALIEVFNDFRIWSAIVSLVLLMISRHILMKYTDKYLKDRDKYRYLMVLALRLIPVGFDAFFMSVFTLFVKKHLDRVRFVLILNAMAVMFIIRYADSLLCIFDEDPD